MFVVNRVKEKNIGVKMPKPRSPEFKVASRRPIEKTQKQPKKTESNDGWDEVDPWDRSDPRGSGSAQAQSDPARRERPRALRSPAASHTLRASNGSATSCRGSNGPRPSQRSQVGKVPPGWAPPVGEARRSSVAARGAQSDFDFHDEEFPPVNEFETPQPRASFAPKGPRNPSGDDQSFQDQSRSIFRPAPESEGSQGAVYPRKYPEAIANLIELSLMEEDKVREAFKGRRQNYVRIFQAYKDKLTDRDYSIIRGATGYLYENSRIKSINEETALWMLGIYEIPASQIQSYTSKAVLEKIAKNCGLSSSGKKAGVLIKNIRSVIDSSK